jgi:hypothetical protein
MGDIQKQDLRSANEQHRFKSRGVGRQATLKVGREQMTQGSKVPQCRGDDVPRQRTVALGESADTGIALRAVELLVERAVTAQYAFEELGGDTTRGKAGSILMRRELRAVHGANDTDRMF